MRANVLGAHEPESPVMGTNLTWIMLCSLYSFSPESFYFLWKFDHLFTGNFYTLFFGKIAVLYGFP